MNTLLKRTLVALSYVFLTCACVVAIGICIGFGTCVPIACASTSNSYHASIAYQVKSANGASAARNAAAAGTKKTASRIKIGCPKLKRGSKTTSYNLKLKVMTTDATWQSASWNSKHSYRVFSVGKNKTMQAIKVSSTKKLKSLGYHIYYRVYVKGTGWLGWAKDGQKAGTKIASAGLCKIKVAVAKEIKKVSVARYISSTNASYTVDSAASGWSKTKSNSQTAGKTKLSARIERLKLSVSSIGYTQTGTEEVSLYSGSVKYRVRTGKNNDNGWGKWKADGRIAGASDTVKYAVQIKLTGTLAKKYDIYYRTYCSSNGWLGWAENGQTSGTESINSPVGALKVCLVAKDEDAPGSTDNFYTSEDVELENGQLLASFASSVAGTYTNKGGESYLKSTVSSKLSWDSKTQSHEKTYLLNGHNVNWRNINPAASSAEKTIWETAMGITYKGSKWKKRWGAYYKANAKVTTSIWHMVVACNGAVGTVVRATVDENFPIHLPSAQWNYMIKSENWERVGIIGAKDFTLDDCEPGDVLVYDYRNSHVTATDKKKSTHTAHTMLYVGEDTATKYFPNATSANVFEGGWAVRKLPGISTHSASADTRMRVFRYVGSLPDGSENINPYDYL